MLVVVSVVASVDDQAVFNIDTSYNGVDLDIDIVFAAERNWLEVESR